jgi:hypothetical protein
MYTDCTVMQEVEAMAHHLARQLQVHRPALPVVATLALQGPLLSQAVQWRVCST